MINSFVHEDIYLLKFFFTRKRAIPFTNPIRVYWQYRRQMEADFPTSLPPEEESILTTTMLLATVKGYTTKPIITRQFKQFKKARLNQ